MKRLFFFVLFLTLNQLLSAQFTVITPKIGLALSKNKDFIVYYKPGYEFGITSEYQFKNKWSIMPALNLEQKGYLEKGVLTENNGSTSNYKIYYSFNYLNLPVVIKYNLIKSNGLYITTGGYAGYMISVTQRFIGIVEGSDVNKKEKKDVSHFYRWNAGFSAGCGYDIPIRKKDRINFDLRFEYDIRLKKNIYPTSNTFVLSVGYSIGVRK